jgi:hypothetical protein
MLLGGVDKCHRCHVHNVSAGYDKKIQDPSPGYGSSTRVAPRL